MPVPLLRFLTDLLTGTSLKTLNVHPTVWKDKLISVPCSAPQVILQRAINRYFVSRLATVILIYRGGWCAQKGYQYNIAVILLWTFVLRLLCD